MEEANELRARVAALEKEARPGPPTNRASPRGSDHLNGTDDTTGLRTRIAALETELRLTQEQLAAAQSGTAYLANVMAGHATTLQQTADAALQGQVQALQESNHQLRRSLEHQAWRGRQPSLLDEPHGWSASQQCVSEAWGENWRPEKSLVDGDDDLMPCEAEGWATPKLGHSLGQHEPKHSHAEQTGFKSHQEDLGIHEEPELDDPFGLGVSGVVQYHRPRVIEEANNSAGEDGIYVIGADGQTFQVSVSADAPEPTFTPTGSSARSAVYFHDHEHRNLSGIAWLVEQLHEDEVEGYWQEYADQHRGHHTAEEWRAYYEANIQPGFLGRQGASGGGSQEEDAEYEPSVVVVKKTVEHDEEFAKHANMEPEQPAQANDYNLQDAAAERIVPNAASKPARQEERLAASRWAPLSPLIGNAAQLEEARAFMSTATRGGDKQRSRGGRGKCSEKVEHPSDRELTARTVHYRRCSSLDIKALDVPSPVPKGAEQAAAGGEKSKYGSDDSSSGDQQQFRAPRGPRLPPRTRNTRQHRHHFERSLFFAKGVDDIGLRRTVVVTGLPADLPLGRVLEKVRGGPLVDMHYLKTAGKRFRASSGGPLRTLTTNGVMLKFLGSTNARAFVEHHQKHPLVFDTAEGAPHKANVSLISTATRPVPADLLAAYHGPNVRLSRVVFVLDSKNAASPIPLAGAVVGNGLIRYPLRAETDENGIIELEFLSMADAAVAYNALKRMGGLDGWQVGYLPDPCAERLESNVVEEDAPLLAKAEATEMKEVRE